MLRALSVFCVLALCVPTLSAQEPDAPAARPAPPGSGAWANYDFVPGNRILFADDFAAERVGNFPRSLELGAGSMELVEWQGMRLIRSNADGFFVINLREVLPPKFTLEMDVIPRGGTTYGEPVIFFDGPPRAGDLNVVREWARENQRGWISIAEGETGIVEAERDLRMRLPEELAGQLLHVRVLVDGTYAKVYVNEIRVANVPNTNLGRSNRIYVGLPADTDVPAFIGNIRIAASDMDLYDALSASGRIAVHGIYFDTGSDRLRPESSGTLRQIADMLAAHPELRLTIEGHTDNVGAAAANRALSERRAASVLQALVGQYGVPAARLSSAGFGDTRPAAPNTTPEGRQQNRRVELVRL